MRRRSVGPQIAQVVDNGRQRWRSRTEGARGRRIDHRSPDRPVAQGRGDHGRSDETLVEIETDKATVELPVADSRGDRSARSRSRRASVWSRGADVIARQSMKRPRRRQAPPTSRPPTPRPPNRARHCPAAQRVARAVGRRPRRGGRHRPRRPRAQGGRASARRRRETPAPAPAAAACGRRPRAASGGREEEVVPMSPIRRRIAERLVAGAADGGAADHLQRSRHVARSWRCARSTRRRFQEKYGIKLGFMSFFVKAAIDALQAGARSQRRDPRRRHRLPQLLRHRHRRRRRQGPGRAGAAQRRAAELRRDRAGDRRLRPARAEQQARARRAPGRHLHHHQRRRLRLAALDADRQPAAERHPRPARHPGSRPWPATARSSSGR